MKNLGKICFLPAVALMFATTSCKKEVNAGFTANKTEAAIGEPVSFTDNEEMRKNATFAWDFGDGATSNERNPTHTYCLPGTYTVQQTVYRNTNVGVDADRNKNRIASSMTTITVTGPTAEFTAPANVGVDETFRVSNTTTGADKGTPVTYEWSYTSLNNTNETFLSDEKNPAIQFSNPGVYTVTLKARQGNCNYESMKSMDITVGSGVEGNSDAAIEQQMRGTYVVSSFNRTISGSTGDAAFGCDQNGTTPITHNITSLTLKENEVVEYFTTTGDQTVPQTGSWDVSEDGRFIEIIGVPNLGDTYALTVSGSTVTGYNKEIQNQGTNCGTAVTYEKTLTLTKQ